MVGWLFPDGLGHYVCLLQRIIGVPLHRYNYGCNYSVILPVFITSGLLAVRYNICFRADFSGVQSTMVTEGPVDGMVTDGPVDGMVIGGWWMER